MAPKTLVRNFFAGGNTAYGFYSLFDYILEKKDGRFIVLKGGPGTGKSTLMKNLGGRLLEKGAAVERFYCSSDSTSLDGVAAPGLKFAVIDGTSPHTVDLKLPGIYDEIIYLGEFWDVEKLLPHRGKLEAFNQKIKDAFAAAYRYLGEANLVLKGLDLQAAPLAGCRKNRKAILGLMERILDDEPCRQQGEERHLFASAITPEGLVHHYQSILAPCREVYILKGHLGSGISAYLETIRRVLNLKGIPLEIYRCALNPHQLDALILPEKGIALVKDTGFMPFTLESEDILCLETVELGLLQADRWRAGLLQEYEGRVRELLAQGIRCLERAKALQMEREPYYSEAMDFQRVKAVEEDLAARFLQQPVRQ